MIAGPRNQPYDVNNFEILPVWELGRDSHVSDCEFLKLRPRPALSAASAVAVTPYFLLILDLLGA